MNRARILLVIGVVALLVTAYELGLFTIFAEASRIRDALVALGPWGYLAFIAAYAALHPFGMPGTVFIVAAPLIWPWPIAFALSMAGTMAGSVVGFSFARFVARDWVEQRIPARFKKYDEALERRGFVTVLGLRLLLWMPPWLHWLFGVSKVRFWTHFWASVLGYLPWLLLVSYFGEPLFEMFRSLTVGQGVALAAATLTLFVSLWLVQRWRAARRPSEPERAG